MEIEWLKKILETAEITDGKLDTAALEAAIVKEISKHTVPQHVYTDLKDRLDTANGQLTALSGVDVDKLQADLQAERDSRLKDRREYQLRAALDKAGALDAEYLLYKLGDTAEFDSDGTLRDAGELLKEARKAHPALFRQEQSGYSPVGGNGSYMANPWKKETFNLTKQGEIFKTDPARAKELMAAAGMANTERIE